MANLKDADGKIVINTTEAKADIDQLNRARQALEDYRKAIVFSEMKLMTVWEGKSYSAFSSKTKELIRDINRAIDQINLSIKSINDTVMHYLNVDKLLADTIRKFGSFGKK